MVKAQSNKDVPQVEQPISALLLGVTKDRYKLSYAALRWAKEIKKQENLADSIPSLVSRAIREILSGKVSIKDIEKLAYLVRAPSTPPAQPSAPTLSLNIAPDSGSEKGE